MLRLAASTALLLPLLAVEARADCAPDDPAPGGAVVCTGTDADGFASGAPGLSVTVEAGASVATTSGGAIRVDGLGTQVEVLGTVEAQGAGDDGVLGLDGLGVVVGAGGAVTGGDEAVDGRDGLIVENAGTLSAGGEGIEGRDRAAVFNDAPGLITAVGDGVELREDAFVDNRGTIVSTGGDGVDVHSGLVLNEGTIEGASAGVEVDASDAPLVLENDGTIRGSTGIDAAGTGNVESQFVRNAGLIEGTGGVAVDLGAGDDVFALEGSGRVIGDVVLGEGTDVLAFADFEGDASLVASLFDGGDALDTIVFATLNSDDVSFVSFADFVLELAVNLPPDVGSGGTYGLRVTNFERIAFVDVVSDIGGDGSLNPIPLPAGGALLMGGLALLAGLRRRRAA